MKSKSHYINTIYLEQDGEQDGEQDEHPATNKSQPTILNRCVSFARIGLLVVTVGLLLGVSAAQAQDKKILRIHNGGDITSLDPHRVSGDWENRVVGDAFMGLMQDGSKAEILPGMAESYTISDDGLTYTFKLRDANWSDGAPVTANDFVFALRRIINPETAAKYAWLMFTINNAEAINSGEINDLTQLGIRAIDAKTLEVKLATPAPYFIGSLTHYTSFPVPEHIVQQYGDDWVKPENIVVNGPFLPTEWVPGSHVKSVKNPGFYEANEVDLDEVIYFTQEDTNAALRSYLAGEYDVLTDLPNEQIASLRTQYPDELRIAPYAGLYYYVLNSNLAALGDRRVRLALSMAIDRELLTQRISTSGEVPAYSWVPPGISAYPKIYEASWKDWPQEQRDAEAIRLIQAAGYGPDNPLSFVLRYNTNENHKRIALAISQMWRKIGVYVQLLNTEIKVHYDDLNRNQFEIGRAGWEADYIDPENFLSLLKSDNIYNYGRWSNPEFDRLSDEAEATTDLAKRANIYYQAEKIAIDEVAGIPIYYDVSRHMVKPHVKNYEVNIKDTHRRRWIVLDQ